MTRFFIPIGVPSPGETLPELPGVAGDLDRLRSVFVDGLGYTPGPLLDNPSAAELRAGLNRWLAETKLTSEDAVVIYYSGHGHIAPTGHYLYTRDFHKDAVADGLRSHALIELVVGRKARPGKVWLILDCCHAGGVLIPELYRDVIVGQTDTFVLAASGSYGQAMDGAFSGAFHEAARRRGRRISLDRITDAINGKLGRARGGTPAIQFSLASKPFDFLDNRRAPRVPTLGSLGSQI
jgi:hypothetical protein